MLKCIDGRNFRNINKYNYLVDFKHNTIIGIINSEASQGSIRTLLHRPIVEIANSCKMSLITEGFGDEVENAASKLAYGLIRKQFF